MLFFPRVIFYIMNATSIWKRKLLYLKILHVQTILGKGVALPKYDKLGLNNRPVTLVRSVTGLQTCGWAQDVCVC